MGESVARSPRVGSPDYEWETQDLSVWTFRIQIQVLVAHRFDPPASAGSRGAATNLADEKKGKARRRRDLHVHSNAGSIHRREFLRTSGGSAAGMLLTAGFDTLAAETGLVAREQKDLIVHGKTPHNAEPSLDKLVASWITPTKHFYVRSHAPAPKIDAGQFRLSVEGMVHQRDWFRRLLTLRRREDRRDGRTKTRI